ncbi:hypothetical protein C3L33_06634, partial [Rhododendron williamsianum]
MEPKISQLVSTLSLFLFLVSSSYSNPVVYDNLVHCLSQNSPPFSPITSLIYTPSNYSYSSILQSSIQNLRFSTPETPKPLAIITPIVDSHVQAAVICCRKHRLQLRIRSGGHDYEGLSYTSAFPFVILDLVNIRSITVNLEENSVWVGAGATVGELTLEQDATKLVHKWQYIGHKFDEKLFIRVIIEAVGEGRTRTIQATFNSLFLGRANQLLELLNESYPELSLQRKHCMEMSWIESVLYFSGYAEGETIDALINRTPQPKSLFKAASDFVQEPLAETALEELWKWCLEEQKPILILEPYGGRMSQIPESDLPFPHRKGNLYNIQYFVKWEDENTSERHLNWIRRVYKQMTPYVSQCPRAAYFNYRDIDLGRNEGMDTTYSEAVSWGSKYFRENFRRLAVVKAEVDPVRIRSGGHDYEGLSYTSQRPFVIIDLANLRKIAINAVDESAWVEAGATIADNVVDAVLVDVNGRILDRKSMGEDLFWAIRGGGAASFGVVLKWKVKLVRVPPKVTVFSISKSLEQGATKLVYNWQNVADKLHKDLNNHGRAFVKSKSDFVTDPISENDLEEMWEEFLTSKGVMIWDLSGGRMNEIPENYSPFPHRAGNLFSIQYYTIWQESKNLGRNEYGKESYAAADAWGRMYFKDNFERLAQIKTVVDPENFFKNEQSIPLI